METMLILGDGALGRAVEAETLARSTAGTLQPARTVRLIGRPVGDRHDPRDLAGASVIVEASRGDAVATNLTVALEAGCRAFVIATTGWGTDRSTVQALLGSHGAVAVAASNFSLGVVLFGRLVEAAVDLFGPLDAFDPYVVEWHRRSKRDRPSGTATDLTRRIVTRHPRLGVADDLEVVSVRAGQSPGMHLVGFDATGETLELRFTARDRSPYAAGILAAVDWLDRGSRAPGMHTFDPVVDELIARDPIAA
jgi:4-hydroxy-tetrahydrodipicolinate reductase